MGKRGYRFNNNVAAIGWVKMPDMFSINSKEGLKDLYMKVYPDKKKMLLIS